MKKKIMKVFFAMVYFLLCFFLLRLIFRNTFGGFADVLAVVCLIIAFILSVGLSEYTVNKLFAKEDND